eukprot:Skav234189  [mRNA]  locus=scaffold1413:83847:84509:- [translate_table: standard]
MEVSDSDQPLQLEKRLQVASPSADSVQLAKRHSWSLMQFILQEDSHLALSDAGRESPAHLPKPLSDGCMIKPYGALHARKDLYL